jgi:hypothetical protein
MCLSDHHLCRSTDGIDGTHLGWSTPGTMLGPLTPGIVHGDGIAGVAGTVHGDGIVGIIVRPT